MLALHYDSGKEIKRMESVPSAAAQILISIIPIVGIVMGSVVIFFFLFWNHREKMLMIEKGMEKKNTLFDVESFSLLAGLLLFGVGISITTLFAIKEGASYNLLGGVIPLSIGLSLILYFIITRVQKRNNDRRAGNG